MKKTLFYLSLLTFVACGQGEKLKLRFAPAVGDKQSMTMKMNMEMGGMMGMSTTMDMEMTTTMTAKDVNDKGDITLDIMYDRIFMGMSAMGKEMKFDSEEDLPDFTLPENVSFIPLASMVNNTFTFKMGERGNVVEAPDMSDLYPDSLKAILGEQANMNQTSQMMENMFAVFPEEEIYTGFSWTAKSDVTTASGPMTIDMTYTVKEINAKSVILDLTGTVTGSSNASGMKMKMEGTVTGSMTVDKVKGWTTSTDLVQDINMTMMGMKMTMKNTITMSTK